MAAYSTAGAGHVVLRRLAQGSAGFERLQALVCALPDHRPDKVKYLLRAMAADELITGGAIYRIASLGRSALAELEAGREFTADPAPSVRVFVSQERAA